MKFRHKIIAAFSLIMTGTLAVLSTVQYINMKQEVESQVESSILEIVNGVRNTVSSELSGKTLLAEYATRMIESDSSETGIEKVLNQPQMKQAFILAGIGFEDGRDFMSNDPSWKPVNYDPKTRSWYKAAKQQGKTIITAPYEDAATGQILVSVGTPVKENGVFSGAIFFDLSLGSLAELVNQVALFDAGYLFIVDNDGTVIAHPNRKFNGKGMSSFLPKVSLREGIQKIEIEGIPYNIDFTPIQGQNWSVGVVLNQNKVFEYVNELRNSSVIYSVIAIILSILLMLVFITKLIRPIQDLNKAIQNVSSGDADLTQRLDTKIDAEFAPLAEGFNQFVINLQTQVTETKQLSHQLMQSTEQISAGAQESSNAMNTQMMELEQLATAMNEMAATSVDVANNVQSAAEFAKQADIATEHGMSVVGQTTEAIHGLSIKR